MSALVARARGLESRLLDEAALREIERATEPSTVARALGRAGIGQDASSEAVERAVRKRVEDDLSILSHWSVRDREAMDVIELDEDRQSLRAIIRGLAAGVPAERRRAATLPTSRLRGRLMTELAAATSPARIGQLLTTHSHPLAVALKPARARARATRGREGDVTNTTIDVLELEISLTKTFGHLARRKTRDHALEIFVSQTIDGENAASALLLAARGSGLSVDDMFVAGGNKLATSTFAAAATSPIDNARDRLATAFAGTPVARAFHASEPAALEDATLEWELATQATLRLREPLGFAEVLHVVLRRRREARRLRRAAWRLSLGGPR